MGVLRPHIPYDPAETALSYAMRLSAIHTGRASGQLLGDLGVKTVKFYVGDPETVRKFAERVGIDPEQYMRGSFRRERRFKFLRGERFTWTFASDSAYRFCPTCIEEDGDRRDRRHLLEWCFRPLRSCPHHGTLLVSTAKEGQLDIRAIPEQEIAKAIEAPVARDGPPPSFATWLSDRLAGAVQDPWLAENSIEQVLGFSEVLGAAKRHGIHSHITDLSDGEREAATECGFRIYRCGPDAIQHALDELYAANPRKVGQSGPAASYGIVYRYCERRAVGIEMEPAMTILFEHILNRFPYGEDHTLFGHPVPIRRFHSFMSFTRAVGAPAKRAMKLLQAGGAVLEDEPYRVAAVKAFPVGEVEPIIETYRSAVSFEDLPDYLGLSRNMARTLVKKRVFKPLIESRGNKIHRALIFSRKPLDETLEAIEKLPIKSEADIDFIPLADACQGKKWTTSEIVSDILSGSRPAVRSPGSAGFASVFTLKSKAMKRYLEQT